MLLESATLPDSIAIFIWRKTSSNEVHDNVGEKMDGGSGVSSSSSEASRYSFEKGPIAFEDEHHVSSWKMHFEHSFYLPIFPIWRIIKGYREEWLFKSDLKNLIYDDFWFERLIFLKR